MASYSVGEAAQLLGVSVDTVRRWTDAGRLATTRTAAGHRVLEGADLARFAVLLAAEEHPDDPVARERSARNRFSGIVTRVHRDGVAAQVELQAGPFRVVSLLTRESADELALEPGMRATAVVKATSVMVER